MTELTRAQREAGGTVRLFFAFGDPHIDGVRTTRVRTLTLRAPAMLHATIFAIKVAGRLIATPHRRRPQYVHVHGDAYEAAVFAVASRMFRTPVVLTVHGLPGRTAGARQAWRIARLGRCRYIGVSSGVVSALRAQLGPEPRIVRQSSGVRSAFFAQQFSGIPQHIVSTGVVSRRRDFEWVIRGAALSRERLRVRIVGDGPDRSRLEELGRALEIDVEIRPESNPETIAVLLSEAVYVHPTSRIGEGFPTSLLEALAVGCPVVTDVFSSLADYLAETIASEGTSPQELARHLDALVETGTTQVLSCPIPTWQDVRTLVDAFALSEKSGQSAE